MTLRDDPSARPDAHRSEEARPVTVGILGAGEVGTVELA